MSWLTIALVSFTSGLLGSLGMGGGAILLIYLRVYGGMEQLAAQGVNLLFFLPIALFSILLHSRSRLIRWKTVGVCLLIGLPMVFGGIWLGKLMGAAWLSRGFALLLAFIGLRELLQK